MTLPELQPKGLMRPFWVYLGATALVGAGYADFPLIAFHFQRSHVVSDQWIPIFYAIAMGVDALAALVAGRLFDRKGMRVLAVAVFVSAWFAPWVFIGGFYPALAGTALWGLGMGVQESIMRAAIAPMVPADKRGSAYGIFNAAYGVCWFLGSALMGTLYDTSIIALIGFSVITQLASIPFLMQVKISRAHS